MRPRCFLLVPRHDLDVYGFLPRANLETSRASSYMALMSGLVGRQRPRRSPQILLALNRNLLTLPTFLREHEQVAHQCAADAP